MQGDYSKRTSFRDELLRRIGRNVVNFQFLESILRDMIPTLSLQTTYPSKHAQSVKTKQKAKKDTLGILAGTFLDGVFYSSNVDVAESIEEVHEITLTSKFQIDADTEKIAERKKGLLRLVVERNKLIHREVLKVDLNSEEQCQCLSEKLDEQNDRIRENLMFLNNIRKAQREIYLELSRYIQPDEFVTAFLSAKQSDTNDKEHQ